MKFEYLKEIKEKDTHSLTELLKLCDSELPDSLSSRVDLNEYFKKISDNGNIVVARENDVLAGFVFFYANDNINKKGYISLIYVNKLFRKKQVAQGLLNKSLNHMKNNGMDFCELSTNVENKKAISLYEKYGFKFVNKDSNRIEYCFDLKKLQETNILLTSVGRRSYLVKYFQEVLNGSGKVFVANSSDISPAFCFADESVVTPLIYDDNYIPFLKDYCLKNKISAIISLFDIDLPILASHKVEFNELGINVIVSDKEIVEVCNDKWLSYNFLKDNKFNVPRTYISFDAVCEDLKNDKISFPIIIKPRWGMGSISIFEADNFEELNILYKKTLKNIKNSYLKYESNAYYDKCIIFQEKLKGQEYGLDVVNDLSGSYINTIVKKKIAMRSGETDCAITVEDSSFKAIGEKISKVTRHVANLDVDMFKCDDKIYILEMNARFGGGYPFSHVAGVNLPKAIIEWIKGNDIDKNILMEEIGILTHKNIDLVVISK